MHAVEDNGAPGKNAKAKDQQTSHPCEFNVYVLNWRIAAIDIVPAPVFDAEIGDQSNHNQCEYSADRDQGQCYGINLTCNR
jgi:hypothetical protein